MNPAVNKIFDKFKEDKVELSTEKVDLSIESALNSLVNDAESTIRKIQMVDKGVEKANDRFEKAKQDFERATKLNTELQSEISFDIKASRAIIDGVLTQLSKVERAAKELGMSPRDVFPKYDDSINTVNRLNKGIDKLNQAYKSIK